MQVKNKEKKLQPIKQPSKAARTMLTVKKSDVPLQATFKESMQRSKGTASIIPQTIQQQEPKINTLQNVCTNLLESGNVQSYIDLFYISHNCIPNVMEKRNYFGETVHIPEGATNTTQESLRLFKQIGENLSKAEIRAQMGAQEKEAAISEYNSMAFGYEEEGDYKTASYFYSKVMESSRLLQSKQFQLVALLGLGKCYTQEDKKDQAIDLLQNAFDEACVLEEPEQRTQMTKTIGKELIQIYIKKATQCEKFNLEVGLQSYESALRIAKKSKELQSEARISHRIGEVYYQEGRYEQSVAYQQNYIQLLQKTLDQEFQRFNSEQLGEKKDFAQEKTRLKFKEMEAHASLAKCYLKLKKIDKAEVHLNSYHKMAKEAKAQNSVADSSYYLAKLFEEKNQREKAIEYYQSYFEAAKSEKPDKKDRKLVDKARVTFAIAKGNKNMNKFIEMLGEDNSLGKILDWKIKRVLR